MARAKKTAEETVAPTPKATKTTKPAAEKAVKAAKPVAEKAPKKAKAPKPEADADGAKGKNVVDTSRYQYATSDVPTASGRKSRDAADPVAEALRGKTVEQVFQVILDNGLEVKDEWRTKNPGMARMAAGNVLRGKFRREGFIKVGRTTISNPEYVAAAA